MRCGFRATDFILRMIDHGWTRMNTDNGPATESVAILGDPARFGRTAVRLSRSVWPSFACGITHPRISAVRAGSPRRSSARASRTCAALRINCWYTQRITRKPGAAVQETEHNTTIASRRDRGPYADARSSRRFSTGHSLDIGPWALGIRPRRHSLVISACSLVLPPGVHPRAKNPQSTI